MSEGSEKTPTGGFSASVMAVVAVLALLAGAGGMYLLTPAAPLSQGEAVEIVRGENLEGLNPGAKLRTWANAYATYTFHQISQIYTVYNWDMRMWYAPGAWDIVNVAFSGELPDGTLHAFDIKVRAQ